MYNKNKMQETSIKVNDGYVGESIEQKVNRILNNKEPITDGAPLIYTERKNGVQGDYDIRTDKWEVALDAMDKVTKTRLTKREFNIGERTYDTMTPEQQAEHVKKFPTSKFKSDKPSQ